MVTYMDTYICSEKQEDIEAKKEQAKLQTWFQQTSLLILDPRLEAKWSHMVFEHPATCETLAMDPKEKQAIINDLLKFSKGKDYYKKIGKA
ncbi:unnamed protein product [Prunus armeniaca]